MTLAHLVDEGLPRLANPAAAAFAVAYSTLTSFL